MECPGGDREADVSAFAGDDAVEPLPGELVVRGLQDALKGSAFAIVGGDGRTHHLDFSDPEMRGDSLIGKRRAASLMSEDIERLQADIAAGKTAKLREGRGRERGVAARTIGMLGTTLKIAKRAR